MAEAERVAGAAAEMAAATTGVLARREGRRGASAVAAMVDRHLRRTRQEA